MAEKRRQHQAYRIVDRNFWCSYNLRIYNFAFCPITFTKQSCTYMLLPTRHRPNILLLLFPQPTLKPWPLLPTTAPTSLLSPLLSPLLPSVLQPSLQAFLPLLLFLFLIPLDSILTIIPNMRRLGLLLFFPLQGFFEEFHVVFDFFAFGQVREFGPGLGFGYVSCFFRVCLRQGFQFCFFGFDLLQVRRHLVKVFIDRAEKPSPIGHCLCSEVVFTCFSCPARSAFRFLLAGSGTPKSSFPKLTDSTTSFSVDRSSFIGVGVAMP